MAHHRAVMSQWKTQDEDVLSYALFPQVARKFMEARNNPKPAEPEKKAADPNAVRELYVEDLGR